MSDNALTRIAADKREHVARRKRERSQGAVEAAARAAAPTRGFSANGSAKRRNAATA